MTAAEQLETAISDLQSQVQTQGDTVRSLKAALKDGNAEKVRSMQRGGCAG
jgi:hypothetical protein